MFAAKRADLAVPLDMSVADLLSTVVSGLGRGVADEGVAGGGWVLQRAGDRPLDPAASLSTSRLRDGDLLYLRTRATRLPAVAFDDVADAIATAVATRTARWQPVHTRWVTIGFAASALIVALGSLVLTHPPGPVTSLVAGGAAALLVLTAFVLARVRPERGPGFVAAGFAVACAVVGASAAGGSPELWRPDPADVLRCAGAALLVATVSLVALGAGWAGLVAVMVVSVLTAAGAGVATLTPLDQAGTASVVAVLALTVSPLLPSLALRLARLPLPTISSDPRADSGPDAATLDSRWILARAVRCDQILTGVLGGVALAVAGAAALLCGRGTCGYALAGVLALVCLLRARLFTGVAQRAALLLAGAVGLASVVVVGAERAQGTLRAVAFSLPAVLAGVVLFAASLTLPARRYAPPLSRAADVLESLLELSVIPLALAVMGVYGALRTVHAG